MCGISAIIRANYGDLSCIQSMNDLIAHRGPDDQGARAFDGRVALGHRRLSILDLSAAGHQPMKDLSGRYWITYNGEVYNYQEIRKELQGLGHVFHTQTDTEVILAAFEEWGEDCLSRFNGMFAFVIYDSLTRMVFAARDRFGVKPIYYTYIDGIFALGSEIKQFTALPGWEFRVNGQLAYDFLNWGVLDHTSGTMFAGVHQLRGGQLFHFHVDSLLDGVPVAKQWYTLTCRPFSGSFEEAAKTYRELLFDSVRLRLHADVDVGSCLSGGLDSSTIVCIAHQLIENGKQKTFTAGSEIPRFDESEFVAAVIEKTGVDSNKVIPMIGDLFKTLPDLVWHQDEPFISSSVFAQWEIFRDVKNHGVKVMLDGQGADEHLGGYHGFFANHLYDLLMSLKWGQLVSESLKTKQRHPQLPLISMLLNKVTPGVVRQRVRSLLGKTSTAADWICSDVLGADACVPYPSSHPFVAQSMQQILHSSVPMLLHFEDRNSMAHGVESRTPFLDYRLVEFSLGCPSDFKVKHGVTKRLLREAAKGILPEKILHRHDKMGFLTAEEVWFKQQAPKLLLEGISSAIELSNGAISPKMYKRTQEMIDEKRPFDYSYWRALCYGAWLARFSAGVLSR